MATLEFIAMIASIVAPIITLIALVAAGIIWFAKTHEAVKDIPKIREAIILIEGHLGINAFVRRKSPVGFTTLAEEVSRKINAPGMLNTYIDKLKIAINARNTTTAYDIQVASFEVAEQVLPTLLSVEDEKMLKDIAYRGGYNYSHLFSIFGILLRDKILTEKGYTGMDVDTSEPK